MQQMHWLLLSMCWRGRKLLGLRLGTETLLGAIFVISIYPANVGMTGVILEHSF